MRQGWGVMGSSEGLSVWSWSFPTAETETDTATHRGRFEMLKSSWNAAFPWETLCFLHRIWSESSLMHQGLLFQQRAHPILHHLWPLAVPSSPNSSCRFGISLSALPLPFSFMMLHVCLHDVQRSPYHSMWIPATHCDWLRDTQCFTCRETSQPDKNSKIKAEDGVSVYTTTTTHTWWLCKTTLFQSRFGFLSWNCTLYL